MDENREISSAPSADCEGRSVKAQSRTTDVHVLERSDCAVVPVIRPNKGRQLPAEVGEGRAQLEENTIQAYMLLTLSGNMHDPASGRCALKQAVFRFAPTPSILPKSRMRKRARPGLGGLCLKSS